MVELHQKVRFFDHALMVCLYKWTAEVMLQQSMSFRCSSDNEADTL